MKMMLFLLAVISVPAAATHTCPTVEYTCVADTFAAADAGDTIYLPEDTATWETTLTFNKAMTIIGAGRTKTRINGTGTTAIFTLTYSNDSPRRISGIAFAFSTNNTGGVSIKITGKSDSAYCVTQNTRIDHCGFFKGSNQIELNKWVYCLIDNNYFENFNVAVRFNGDESYAWKRPITAGSLFATYVETDTFFVDNNADREPNHAIYHQSGSRSVVRYCVFNFSTYTTESKYALVYDSHGNWGDPITAYRGQPILEFYENTMAMYRSNVYSQIRGGAILWYNNTATYLSGSAPTLSLREEEVWKSGGVFCPTCPIDTVWPMQDQVTNSFFWNNTMNGSPTVPAVYSNGDTAAIHLNRDYFLHAPLDTGGLSVYTLPDRGTIDSFQLDTTNAFYPYTAYKYPFIDDPVYLCTLTVSTTTGGNVSPSGAQSDTCGDTLQVIALPVLGHIFSHWSVSANVGITDSTADTTDVWKTDSTNGVITAYFTDTLAAPVKYGTSTYYLPIKTKAASVLVADTKVPLVLSKSGIGAVIAGCSDSAGLDIVLTTAAGIAVPCTLVAFSKVDSTFQMYLQDPAQSTLTGGTQLYLQYGGAAGGQNGSSIWQNVHGSTDDYFLVMSGDTAGGKLVDISKNYTAIDTGALYGQTGPVGKAVKYDTAAVTSWGNITQMANAVTWSGAMWLKADTLAKDNQFFGRYVNGNNKIVFTMAPNPLMRFYFSNVTDGRMEFDHTTVMTAGQFAYIQWVYNGAGLLPADKVKVRVNGVSAALGAAGTLGSTLVNTTNPVRLGNSTGRTNRASNYQDEVMLYSGILDSNRQKLQYANQNGFSTNAVFDIGAAASFPYLCTLTVSTTAGGNVSPSGAQIDTCGDTLAISATPKNTYAFSHWSRTANIGILDSSLASTSVWKTDSTSGEVTAYFIKRRRKSPVTIFGVSIGIGF